MIFSPAETAVIRKQAVRSAVPAGRHSRSGPNPSLVLPGELSLKDLPKLSRAWR